MTRTSLSDIISCLSGYDPDAISVNQARQIISDFVPQLATLEKLAIRSALDRVLAQDIVSGINVPASDNSAMDGYALCGSDLPVSGERTLPVVATIHAGQHYPHHVSAGTCVRIMTGAVMPDGCDTVVPQELTHDASDSTVTIPAGAVKTGDNRRRCGEDLQAGQTALRRGKILRPADIGLLASLGVAEVAVQRRLRVAFFSTGDELRSVGEVLTPGCVYDSNRYTLYGMLKRLGCEMFDMGVINDDPAALEAAFRSAAEHADAVITSGGVSVGAADYTKQIMQQLGDMSFWKIGMRPGRPMAFGRIASGDKEAYLFGLPGNPVAVMISFYFIVRDALLHMMGAVPAPLPRLQVVSLSAIRKRPGRTEYQRGILSAGDDGIWRVRLTGEQGSGILRSMSDANCIVVLDDAQGNVASGDLVQVVLFDGLV